MLLADVSLQFGMSRRARKILEEIMPQVFKRLFLILLENNQIEILS
jgi:hypothetical protein